MLVGGTAREWAERTGEVKLSMGSTPGELPDVVGALSITDTSELVSLEVRELGFTLLHILSLGRSWPRVVWGWYTELLSASR